jgi:hypothetical protein
VDINYLLLLSIMDCGMKPEFSRGISFSKKALELLPCPKISFLKSLSARKFFIGLRILPTHLRCKIG